MQLQSRKAVGFTLLLLCVFSVSNSVCRGQVDSQKPSAASESQGSVTHASCGFQANEVLVLSIPGAPSVIATVKCGEELTIIYDEVGFYRVQIGNATRGYISKSSVTDSNQQTPVYGGNREGVAHAGMNGIGQPECSHCPDPQHPVRHQESSLGSCQSGVRPSCDTLVATSLLPLNLSATARRCGFANSQVP
jgi:hypothetical protein